MAGETFLLKPKLDPKALKLAEGKLKKLFDPTEKVIKATTRAVRGFQSSFEKVDKISKSTARSAKESLKARRAAQKEAEKMGAALRKAEKHMGAGSRELKQMRSDYKRVLGTVKEIGRETDKRIRSERAAARAEARRARFRAVAGRAAGGVRAGAAGVARGAGRAAVGVAAAGVAGVAAGLVMLEKTRASADRAAKSANLGVEEFGRLKHAAELSGTSIEVVEKSTQKLESLLSKKPTAEFSGGLKALGLEAKQLQGLKPEQQLSLIADAMQGVEDDQMRTVIASRLFGEEMGAKLVPMLQNGSGALKEMGDEAVALGLVFDEKTAAAAERFGDAQDKLTKSLSGFTREVFSQYMPALADATEGAVAWIQENREQITAWIEGVVNQLISAGEAAAEWAQSVDWGEVWAQIQEAGDTIKVVIDLILEMTEALGGAGTATLAIGLAATSAIGPLGGLAVAGAAAGYKIGEAMHRAKNEIIGANAELRALADRARTIQGLAKLRAASEAADEPDRKAEALAQRNQDLAGKADRAGSRARAAATKIYGKKIPRDVQAKIAHMERVISTGSASDASKRAAVATLNRLESQASKKGARARRKTLGSDGAGGGKREVSAASAAVESDIKSFSETAGRTAYARAIQSGASEREANKAALAEQKRVAKDLKARAPELIKAGTLGQGTSALAGTPLTAGGALPIALDLGSKGGPPPVQVVNAPTNFTFEFPDAKFDATMDDFGPMIEPVVREALSEMWGRLLPNYASGQIR